MNIQYKIPITSIKHSHLDQVRTSKFNLKPLAYVFLASFFVLVAGCSPQSSIEGTARAFVRAMSSGNSDMASHYVCQESGVAVLVGLRTNWSGDSYEILEDDGLNARVNVRGRIQIPDSEIKEFLQKLQTGIKLTGAEWPTGVLNPNDAPIAMTIIVDLDFDNLQLKNSGDNWCVQQQSIIDFYEYLAQLIVDQIAQ